MHQTPDPYQEYSFANILIQTIILTLSVVGILFVMVINYRTPQKYRSITSRLVNYLMWSNFILNMSQLPFDYASITSGFYFTEVTWECRTQALFKLYGILSGMIVMSIITRQIKLQVYQQFQSYQGNMNILHALLVTAFVASLIPLPFDAYTYSTGNQISCFICQNQKTCMSSPYFIVVYVALPFWICIIYQLVVIWKIKQYLRLNNFNESIRRNANLIFLYPLFFVVTTFPLNIEQTLLFMGVPVSRTLRKMVWQFMYANGLINSILYGWITIKQRQQFNINKNSALSQGHTSQQENISQVDLYSDNLYVEKYSTGSDSNLLKKNDINVSLEDPIIN